MDNYLTVGRMLEELETKDPELLGYKIIMLDHDDFDPDNIEWDHVNKTVILNTL